MLTVARQTSILFNDEYVKYQDMITTVQHRLKRDISLLGLEPQDERDALEYSNDRVTIFRFLKDTEYVENEAVTRMLDTIQWRIENKVNRMTFKSISSEFFDEGFAFFYKQDLIGRPVAIIQMRYFPKFKDKSKSLSDFMQPFACLVMEMARQITRDVTRRNEQEQVKDKPILISQISIIIDIAKAPFVPVDSNLMQALKNIVNSRFPGFVGSVYIMNFGWMYQGIWQVVKLVLSEQAKSRVSFTTSEEMKQVMDENDLLKVLGGKDDYEWSLDSDKILELYATESRFIQSEINSPQLLSPRLSRRSSVSSYNNAVFFDAPEFLSTPPSSSHLDIIRSSYTSASPSVYGTPGSLTPINSYNRQQQNQLITTTTTTTTARTLSFEPRYFLNGFHLGDSFLTSFFRPSPNNSNQHNQSMVNGSELAHRLNELLEKEGISNDDFIGESVYLMNHSSVVHFPHMLPDSHPQSIYVNSPLKHQLIRAEQKVMRLSRRLFHLSFAYKGAVYWVLLYCFLRGPVENSVKKTLLKLLTGSTAASHQQIAYTTLGITATVAAVLSASFATSLQSDNYYNKRNHR